MNMEADRSPVIDPDSPSEQIYRIPERGVRKLCAQDRVGTRGVASAGIRPGVARRCDRCRAACLEQAVVPVQTASPRRWRDMNRTRPRFWWFAWPVWAAASAFAAEPLPLFDAHLHYNAEAAAVYPVPAALEI